jgi:hypothetical protein
VQVHLIEIIIRTTFTRLGEGLRIQRTTRTTCTHTHTHTHRAAIGFDWRGEKETCAVFSLVGSTANMNTDNTLEASGTTQASWHVHYSHSYARESKVRLQVRKFKQSRGKDRKSKTNQEQNNVRKPSERKEEEEEQESKTIQCTTNGNQQERIEKEN